MGQGLGPAYLARHVARLLAGGAPAVGIDPHPDNTGAIQAYEKVGFSGDGLIQTKWGLARIMSLWPQ